MSCSSREEYAERETTLARKLLRQIELYRANDWRVLRCLPLIRTVMASDGRVRALAVSRMASRSARVGSASHPRSASYRLPSCGMDSPFAPIRHVAGCIDRCPIVDPTIEDANHGTGDHRA
jgi:hypothetical protein